MAIESFEIFSAARKLPNVPVSGVEADSGKSAVALGDFSQNSACEGKGRIRFDGEEWNAKFYGEPGRLPRKGERVEIVEIDTANLIAKVK